jgi:putative membrane protein
MKTPVVCVALIAFATTAPALIPSVVSAQTATQSSQMMTAPMFVQMAAMSDMFEIQSSQAALNNSKDAEVRKFAQIMIDDHTKMSAELKAAVQAGNVSAQIPTALAGEKAQMLQQLSGMMGEQFDQMYWKAQVQGHQKALQLAQSYAKNGDNAALKAHAQKGADHRAAPQDGSEDDGRRQELTALPANGGGGTSALAPVSQPLLRRSALKV